jgi:hypothetical protein
MGGIKKPYTQVIAMLDDEPGLFYGQSHNRDASKTQFGDPNSTLSQTIQTQRVIYLF